MGEDRKEKTEGTDEEAYYFIFPEGTAPEIIKHKLPHAGKNFPLIVGAGLAFTSLVFEVAVKSKLLQIHDRFNVMIPFYTKYSFFISLFFLIVYFAFIILKKEVIEYKSEGIAGSKIKVVPILKEDKLLNTFMMIVLFLYAAFIIIATLGPILQMLMK